LSWKCGKKKISFFAMEKLMPLSVHRSKSHI
jgi:hypothetical protein